MSKGERHLQAILIKNFIFILLPFSQTNQSYLYFIAMLALIHISYIYKPFHSFLIYVNPIFFFKLRISVKEPELGLFTGRVKYIGSWRLNLIRGSWISALEPVKTPKKGSQ